MSHSLTAPASSRWATIGTWSLQVLLALVFLAAGGAKLAGAPMMVAVFDLVGIGQWFRIVTGGIEVVAAIALLIPGYAGLAALALGGTMVGAVVAHLLVIPTSAVPALVLLVLSLLVAWLRRDQLFALVPGDR